MGSIGVSVSAEGWDSTIRGFKAMPAEIKKQVRAQSRTLAEPLAASMRSAGTAQGSHAAAVGRRARATSRGGVPAVTASGLPYVMGSEYGGGIRRTTYYSRRGATRFLVVGRHTTAQFRPFVGPAGYWWNPNLRGNSRGRAAVLEGWSKIVDDVISGF